MIPNAVASASRTTTGVLTLVRETLVPTAPAAGVKIDVRTSEPLAVVLFTDVLSTKCSARDGRTLADAEQVRPASLTTHTRYVSRSLGEGALSEYTVTGQPDPWYR